MAKTKLDRIEDVERMIREMSVGLTACNIKIPTPTNIQDVKSEFIIAGEKWLKEVTANEYAEIARIRAFKTDSAWKMAESLNKSSIEMTLWRNAKKNFRAKIISQGRPKLFKKSQWKEIIHERETRKQKAKKVS